MFLKTLILCSVFTFFSQVFSQESIVDEVTSKKNEELAPSLAIEKIEKISPSSKIFIITNTNSSFNKGDYISLLYNANLAARALVAKTTGDGLAGIKILKIYSLKLWSRMRKGTKIQIIRGDDSFYRLQKEKANEEENQDSLIKDDEDLFNKTTFLEDDLSLEEASNRIIKQDNVISLTLGQVESIDNDGSPQKYSQMNIQWSYQVEDNIWAELSYGQNLIDDFPNTSLQTKLTNLTIKGKYTIKAPFFSYIQPYAGYQIIGASSPGAGTPDIEEPNLDLEAELKLIEDSKKNSIIFGLSVLKRLVPGWFIRADIGTDILGIGFGLEF